MSFDFYGLGNHSLDVLVSVLQNLEFALSIAGYVLFALGLYAIAKRRGLKCPWLGWVPVAGVWLLGSIADQYQYVSHGKVTNKRKSLLILDIISCVASLVLWTFLFVSIFRIAFDAVNSLDEEAFLADMIAELLRLGGWALVILPVGITLFVIKCMALFDIYRSLNPQYAVLFLVLSIFFPVTEPFFIFCNRNKDLGMPPRKPIYEAMPATMQEPQVQWQQPQVQWRQPQVQWQEPQVQWQQPQVQWQQPRVQWQQPDVQRTEAPASQNSVQVECPQNPQAPQEQNPAFPAEAEPDQQAPQDL